MTRRREELRNNTPHHGDVGGSKKRLCDPCFTRELIENWRVCPNCEKYYENKGVVDVRMLTKKYGMDICFSCGITWKSVERNMEDYEKNLGSSIDYLRKRHIADGKRSFEKRREETIDWREMNL